MHKTHMDKDDIAQWIRDGLTRSGKSQSALAAWLRLDASQGNRIANGSRGLQAHELYAVADFLGCPRRGSRRASLLWGA